MLDRKYSGKVLDGRYEIRELLGVGGMALVYHAFDLVEQVEVAIKILKDEFLDNDEFIKRFSDESRTISVLSHPNIVKVHDVNLKGTTHYIVMEYINGITLKEYIEQQKVIPWKDSLFFTVQILKALDHAHQKGIIHRDIKPQNIMLLQDGTVKVTDFGIAKSVTQETRTITNRAIGSVHYISPEQARGDATTSKADIYSVGVILYEMLTGKLPFEAESAVSVAIMQLQSTPTPPRQVNQDIPEGLEEITLKAMQKNPKYRYTSVEDMQDAIEEFRKNPSIRFEYKYFENSSPTKYLDAINLAKGKRGAIYEDDYLVEEPDKRSRAINIIIGAGAAILLISVLLVVAIFTGWFGWGGKDVDVPSFIDQRYQDIVNNPTYKFQFERQNVYDPTKPEGRIVDQDPKPFSKKVKEDSKIVLKVNTIGSTVVVPALKGLNVEVAKQKLKEVGLSFEVLAVDDPETPEGVVSHTDPEGAKEVTYGTAVKLFVSKGAVSGTGVVPNVIGKNLSDATSEIVSKGLKVNESIKRSPSDKPADTVISVEPLPGTEINLGTAISLTVSSGTPLEKTVPISVDLPSGVNRDVDLRVYVDAIYDQSQSKTVRPSYSSSVMIYVRGTKGIKRVIINLDGTKYREYEVNLDEGTVRTVGSYNFTNHTVSQTSSSSHSGTNSVTPLRTSSTSNSARTSRASSTTSGR